VVEPAPVQKPHPPLWIGAFSPDSIRQAAENGFNLLLGQNGSPELVAESVGIYRKAIEAQGRVFDPMTVGLTRALHIAMNPEEREAAHRLRMQFMRNVQQLSLSPAGDSPTLGRPRRTLSEEDMRKATETDALLGTPDEIVGRLERLRAAGVEYVLLIDVGGSLTALRRFARKVMPEFAA
jgi:alkanesulfonate monooxygenase SsuD/methylene tetrahydromethanopterin reductase-like flavin-dependent oxidoreductase (luciferase family)